MHLVPGKLDSVMVFLCDVSLTTVRLEMPKRQIDAVFIYTLRQNHCAAHRTENRLSLITNNYIPGSRHRICI